MGKKIIMEELSKDTKLEFLVDGKDINELIDLFKQVNPSYKLFFKNTRQRSSLERIILEIGYEKTKWTIQVLKRTNCMQFCPVITSPLELENRLGKLIACLQRIKGNKKVIGVAM